MANEKEKDNEARLKALEEQNAKLMALLEAKAEREQGSQFTPDVLREIVSGVATAAAGPSQVLASKLKPENADHLHVSVFEHPEGGLAKPKPALKREMWFAGREIKTTDVNYPEAVALNALSDSLGRSQRRIARDGKWVAAVSDDDRKLTVSVPMKTIDDRQDLPSFLAIVQELTSGEKPLEQADMLAQIALMKAQIEELQAARV